MRSAEQPFNTHIMYAEFSKVAPVTKCIMKKVIISRAGIEDAPLTWMKGICVRMLAHKPYSDLLQTTSDRISDLISYILHKSQD